MIVEQFLQWLTTATAEQRAVAAGPLVRACLHGGLQGENKAALDAIMTVFLDDGDRAVRKALAEALAVEPEAPHHLILTLANDEPDIAALVVGASTVLLDAELVDIVASAPVEVQIAAAGRDGVAPGLAAAIAEVADLPALSALLANRRAAIPHFSLQRIVERSGGDVDVLEAMLDRPGVPIGIRQALLEELSVACHDLMLMRSTMREDRVQAVLREAKDKATLALAAEAGDDEVRPLAEHLRDTGQLTTMLLLRAACTGNIRFMREALSLLSRVPSSRVSALLSDGREAGFRAVYRKAGMPVRIYPAFQAALEVNRERAADPEAEAADHGFARRVIERVLERTQAAGAEVEDLVVVLRRFAAEAAREQARRYVAATFAQPAVLPAPPVGAIAEADEAEAAYEEAFDEGEFEVDAEVLAAAEAIDGLPLEPDIGEAEFLEALDDAVPVEASPVDVSAFEASLALDIAAAAVKAVDAKALRAA
jgi:uncharacterized protein (DUF2336 family)